MAPAEAAITGIEVRAYAARTNASEADGTFAWDRTTMVLVEATAGERDLRTGSAAASRSSRAPVDRLFTSPS